MTTKKYNTELNNLDIIDEFHFGHNMLRSTASLEQFFSQIYEILSPIIKQNKATISDINFDLYDKDRIRNDKINICWWRLDLGEEKYLKTWFIILNPRKGVGYSNFTISDVNDLLLKGKTNSGWYLLNQVQCLEDFITNEDFEEQANIIFTDIISLVISELFIQHEKNYSINHHYTNQFLNKLTNVKADIDSIIDNIQVQSSANTLGGGDSESSDHSIYYIYGRNETIAAATKSTKIRPITNNNIANLIHSKYLFNRSDVSVFLKNIENQDKQLNIRFFYNLVDFKKEFSDNSIRFLDNNYSIQTQLIGKFKITYTDGSTKLLPPTCQAITVTKTQDMVFFVVMLYASSFLSKTIDKVDYDDVRLIYKITGAIK